MLMGITTLFRYQGKSSKESIAPEIQPRVSKDYYYTQRKRRYMIDERRCYSSIRSTILDIKGNYQREILLGMIFLILYSIYYSSIRSTISDIKGNHQRKFLLGKIFLVLYAEGIYITLKEKDGSVNLRRWGSQRSLKKNWGPCMESYYCLISLEDRRM